jgi:hypothetical protein
VGVASRVTVSTRVPGQVLSHSSHYRKGPIQRFLSNTGEVQFEDGSLSRFDKIIWCTGYTYDISFVKDHLDGQVFTEDFRVTNTYEHVFYIPRGGDPSLAFVGLLKTLPWPVLELQASLIAKVFAGRDTTPSRHEMKAQEEQTIAYWQQQCVLYPTLDRMYHHLEWANISGAMTSSRLLPYMNHLFHWITRSVVAQPSLNAGPAPPFFCLRMQ